MPDRLGEPVDLTNCDREPIHIPGSIQPHGCLLACDTAASTVLRHSQNAPALLGHGGELNGRKLDDVLGPKAAHAVRNGLARAGHVARAPINESRAGHGARAPINESRAGSLQAGDAARPALIFALKLADGRAFDVAVHRFKANVIVELEPAHPDSAQPLELTRNLIGRIRDIDTTYRLLSDSARLVQALLGYDRVMIYQFAHDGAGKVMAEARRGDLETFLGLYFPASDIPQQARALYLRNTIRIISDVDFARIPIEPVLDASGEPLDLSHAHLRSVSPIHCEYLRNMGVSASMSISIVVDGALWGLIACHHYSPRVLSMAERVAAEVFGEFFSLHLNTLKQRHKLEAANWARSSLDRFLRVAARSPDIAQSLRDHLGEFGKLIPCDGVGMWLHGIWTGTGATPPEEAVQALAGIAGRLSEGRVWATHNLSHILPEAEGFADRAAGVLVVPLSQRPRDYLLFFRKELVQTVDWAGNPEKSYDTGPLGDRLTPRKSFSLWKETVRGQSQPWTEEEREIAEATRAALVEVVLHHAELLADERAKADVRQRMLNEELSHRVKNILAVIKSMVTHPTEAGQTVETYVDALRGRIQALGYAHDQVIRGDGGGQLRDLLEAELTPYRAVAAPGGAASGMTGGPDIALDGPPVWLDARAFSVLALVLHELATNAAKYGALSRPEGRLAVEWRFDAAGACAVEWRESGGPSVKPPTRHGFGTVLIDRSIPYDLGGESRVDYPPSGVRARFVIPGRHARPPAGEGNNAKAYVSPPQPAAWNAARQAGRDSVLAGTRILVVEDQMLIAMDLEHILREQGVGQIVTAASATEALRKLQQFTPDAAILDVNLGAETSTPVAEELERRNVPFTFATGYGDRSMIPPHLLGAPVIRKPYEAASIVGQVAKLLGK